MEVVLEVKPIAAPVYACRACLETEDLLYDLSETDFLNVFSEFTGHSVFPSDGYPQYICKLCLYLLRKFVKFRHRCIKAMYLLQQLEAEVGVITTDSVKELDREKLKHNFVCTQTTTLEVLDINTASTDYIIKPETLRETKESFYDDEKIFNEQHNSPNNISDIDDEDQGRSNDSSDYDDEDIKPLIRKTRVEKAVPKKTKLSQTKALKTRCSKIISDKIIEETSKVSKQENQNDIRCGNLEIAKQSLKAAPKKVKRITQDKTSNNSNKPKRRDILLDKELQNVSESCKQRMEEIKRDIAAGKCHVSKLRNYKIHVKRILKEAEIYNLKVIFLTKAEQILELEEMRKSERFNDAKYKCEKCCAIYRTAEKLNRHAVSHNPSSGAFVCEICGLRFKTATYLNHHDLSRHKNRIYCKTCGRVVAGKYKKHYEWHQGKHELYKCEHCNVQFTVRKQYLMHVIDIHGGHMKGPECLLCDDGRSFLNAHGLMLHAYIVHKGNPRCSSCKVVFADSDALTVHGNAPGGCHTGYSTCQKCGNNFRNENEMMTHFNEVHRKNYFKCYECPRQFKNMEMYEKHTKNHLTIPQKGFEDTAITVQYNRYDRPSSSGTGLKKKYTSVKRPCQVCGKLKDDRFYDLHMRTHTGEKPYQCDVCKKSFSFQPSLKTHMLMHTGERRFKCDLCDKAFKQVQHLKSHMVSHTGEKAHECPICKKRFGYKTTVREHVRTVHEGLPPFKRNRLVKRAKEEKSSKIRNGDAATQWTATQMENTQ